MKSIFSFWKKRPQKNNRILHFRDVPTPPRQRLLKTRFVINHARKYRLLSIGFAICFVFFIFFLSPVFRVQNVEVVRKNLSIDAAEIEQWLAHESLGKNIFFVSLSDLNDKASKEFSQWKSVRIRKKFPHTLYAEVENFKAYAFLIVKREIIEKPTSSSKAVKTTKTTNTKATTKTVLQEEKYVINEKGIVSYADVGEVPSMTIRYNDVFPDQISVGKSLLPPEVIEKIDLITKKLIKDHELATKEVIYFPTGKEIHVNLYQFSLWFDLLQDTDEQLQKFSKSLSFLDKNKVEYMDLRIKNRVIYKEKK